MTRSTILARARARITDPARWCGTSVAKSADGTRVDYDDPSAVRWCGLGALHVERDLADYGAGGMIEALYFAARRMGHGEFACIREHAIVLEVYDEAIQMAVAGEVWRG
jgi:hypothetical protein